MLRKSLLVALLAVTTCLVAAPASRAQYYQADVYTVSGRVLRVDRGDCGYVAAEVDASTYACDDWIWVDYYTPDRYRQRAWIDAQSFDHERRPQVGDVLQCEIDAETYELIEVRGWHRPRNVALYFRFAPPYHRHYIDLPWYRRYHHPSIYPRRYRSPFWPPDHGPYIYPRSPRSPTPGPHPGYEPPRRPPRQPVPNPGPGYSPPRHKPQSPAPGPGYNPPRRPPGQTPSPPPPGITKPRPKPQPRPKEEKPDNPKKEKSRN